MSNSAPRGVEQSIALLKSPDPHVYLDAISALAKGATSETIDLLKSIITDTAASETTRERAAMALAGMSDEQSKEFLCAALTDARLSRYASAALGHEAQNYRSIDPVFIQPLISAFGDEDWSVRGSVVTALGACQDPRAVEPLINALNDTVWDVRRRAVIALGRIGDPRAIEPLRRAAAKEADMGDWIRSRVQSDFSEEMEASSTPKGRRWWRFGR